MKCDDMVGVDGITLLTRDDDILKIGLPELVDGFLTGIVGLIGWTTDFSGVLGLRGITGVGCLTDLTGVGCLTDLTGVGCPTDLTGVGCLTDLTGVGSLIDLTWIGIDGVIGGLMHGDGIAGVDGLTPFPGAINCVDTLDGVDILPNVADTDTLVLSGKIFTRYISSPKLKYNICFLQMQLIIIKYQ